MFALALVASVVLAVCGVLLVFGCVCHLFRKKLDSSNYNDAESAPGYSVFPDDGTETSSSSQITFEPLPDILAKTVSATALRPRISSLEKDKQENSSKLVAIHQPFARSQLTYIKEMGIGWFGQVLQGDADNIVMGTKKSKVIVKLLKDDANSSEQKLFLEEVAPYRELDHSNIMRLLGQCTEALPYLVIMEFSPYNDLKTYLKANQAEIESFHQRNLLFKFATDMAAGLACMHRHNYVHHDFAARNCMVMTDMTVKVGDYGIAEDQYRDDYYDTGRDLVPIRWMAPESLAMKYGVWNVVQFSKQTNIWSFGVVLWELAEFGKMPYTDLPDDSVLQEVISTKSTHLPLPGLLVLQKDQMYEIMKFCWRDASQRPTIEEIHTLLQQLPSIMTDLVSDFDTKWQRLSSNEPSIVVIHPEKTDIIDEDVNSQPESISTENEFQDVTSESTSEFAPSVSIQNSTDISIANSAEKGRDGSSSDSKIPTINSFDLDIASRQTTNKTPDMLDLGNSSLDNESIIITGGTCGMHNDSQEEAIGTVHPLMLTFPTDGHLIPVEMSTPCKNQSLLSSTSKSTDYFSALSSQPGSTASGEYAIAVGNSNQSNVGLSRNEVKTNGTKDTPDTIADTVPLENDQMYEPQNENEIQTEIRQEIVYENEVFGIDNNNIQPEEEESFFNVVSEDSFVILNLEKGGDNPNGIELEASPSKSSDQSDTTADSSDVPESSSPSITDSPSKEEIEVAKELYISRGTSLNTSKDNTPRSLSTIPEDRIPLDNTSHTELHFDEAIEDSFFTIAAQDSFEWDDYIGEQLVGKVQYPNPSPKHSMEITDWTFDHDSVDNSNPSSISKDDNSSIASDNRPSSIASNLGTRSSVPDGEVKNTSGGGTHSFVSDILTNRVTPRSTNLMHVDQSKFYSILNSVDVDSVSSDTEVSLPILSMTEVTEESRKNETLDGESSDS